MSRRCRRCQNVVSFRAPPTAQLLLCAQKDGNMEAEFCHLPVTQLALKMPVVENFREARPEYDMFPYASRVPPVRRMSQAGPGIFYKAPPPRHVALARERQAMPALRFQSLSSQVTTGAVPFRRVRPSTAEEVAYAAW